MLLQNLTIGVWHMMGPGDGVIGWTLAPYIVTATAGKFQIVRMAIFADQEIALIALKV